MKQLFTLALSLVTLSLSWAQNTNDYIELTREVLKVEKKATIAEVMQMTEEESEVFWPLYNEYERMQSEIQNERISVILDYAENFENITEEMADEYLTRMLDYQNNLLALKKMWYKKFKNNMPNSIGKIATFFQAENKIEALISAELAKEIPLLDIK